MEAIAIMSLVIGSLVILLGVLGNGVVIWVTGFKMKKTVKTVWYLNLAVADFIATASLPLQIPTIAALDWTFGTFICKMGGFVFFVNMCASICTLMVISVDRCVSVVCQVWTQNHRNVRKAYWVSLGVWVLSLAYGSPFLIFLDTQPSGNDKVLCKFNYAPTGDYSRAEVHQLWRFRAGAMFITGFLMGFVVPFTVIVSCYSVIIYRLWKNLSLASQLGRSFKIIAAVITAFFLCWLPLHIMLLIYYMDLLATTDFTGNLPHVATIGLPVTSGLAILNSCLNPLLYVFMGQDFKDVFRSSVLKVMEKVFAEEPNPGCSIYVTAPLQAPTDTPASLLPPPAPTPTPGGQGFKDVFHRSVLNVLAKNVTEELPQTNPGSSIYVSAVSQIQDPNELQYTPASLLPPLASTPTPSTQQYNPEENTVTSSSTNPEDNTPTSITSSSTQQYSPEENTITNISISNIMLDLPQSLPGDRLFAVRTNFIKGISQASLKCLLDELLVKKVLNDSELEEANGVQLRGDKARFVTDAVRNKGAAASSIMIKILCEIDPFLSEHLGLKH